MTSPSFLSAVNVTMRPFALLGLSALATAAITRPTTSDHNEVIEEEAGREYTVKLECVGCPLRAWTSPHKAEWLHPAPKNSLVSALYSAQNEYD